MKKKNRNWTNRKKFLNKTELNHLSVVAKCRTKAQFQHTINDQEKKRKENNFDPRLEPCWDCKNIARKLNMKPGVN